MFLCDCSNQRSFNHTSVYLNVLTKCVNLHVSLIKHHYPYFNYPVSIFLMPMGPLSDTTFACFYMAIPSVSVVPARKRHSLPLRKTRKPIYYPITSNYNGDSLTNHFLSSGHQHSQTWRRYTHEDDAILWSFVFISGKFENVKSYNWEKKTRGEMLACLINVGLKVVKYTGDF